MQDFVAFKTSYLGGTSNQKKIILKGGGGIILDHESCKVSLVASNN